MFLVLNNNSRLDEKKTLASLDLAYYFQTLYLSFFVLKYSSKSLTALLELSIHRLAVDETLIIRAFFERFLKRRSPKRK